MPRRAVPADGDRGAWLQHRDPWPEDVQRRRHSLQAAVRGRARTAGRRERLQSRYIEAVVPAGDGVVRVACVYLPNGNPVGTEKYPYKLAFMERLITHTRQLLEYEEPLVLAGDFNVIPDGRDATRPEDWVNDALFLPQTRCKIPRAHVARPDRRPARDHGRRRPVHVLGLSGRRLAEEQRHPHRPPAFVSSGRRQGAIGRHRQGDARPRQGLRPYADTRSTWPRREPRGDESVPVCSISAARPRSSPAPPTGSASRWRAASPRPGRRSSSTAATKRSWRMRPSLLRRTG